MKQYKITIEPASKSFYADADETLLEAGLRHSIDLPFSCQEGDCGTCISQLRSGEVAYPRSKPDILTPHELNTGYILTCCAIPRDDCTLWIDDLTAPDTVSKVSQTGFICPLIHCRILNKKITEIMVAAPPQSSFEWKSGQYVQLLNTQVHEYRPYTIGSRPSKQLIFYLHHETPYNRQLIDQVILEKHLTITGPYGQCRYPSSSPSQSVLLVAGGTGFAQLRAIAEAAFLDPGVRQIDAFWGARTKEDFHSLNLCDDWAKQYPHFNLRLAISEPDPNWKGPTGFIHQVVLKTLVNLSDYNCYTAGPPDMVAAAKKAFIHAGLKEEQFYAD